MMREPAQTVEESLSSVRIARRLTRQSLERMRLPLRFWNADFALISESRAKVAIGKYVRKMDEALARGFGFIIWGNNSVGKTAAAIVCLKEARRRGKMGLFLTAQQYISDVMNKIAFDDSASVQQRAKDVDLLILDDLGKESDDFSAAKDTTEAMLEDLIRQRYSNLKSTIITSNLDPEKMTERYNKSFIQVLIECCPLIEMDGPSQRELGQRDLIQFFNE